MFYNKKTKLNPEDEKIRKIQEIYKDEMNNECFDCGKPDPGFISANNGIFICKECMIIHYQFPDEISLIIKNNLFLLNKDQINYIYFGGNRKLFEFINYEYPQLQNYSPEIMYITQAMQYYRDTLYYLVEGGNKPLKPNEHFAYKVIKKIVNYPMTEKRKKNKNYISINGRNNNLDNNFNLTYANEDNLSNKYNSSNNLNDNEEFQNNSYSHQRFKILEDSEDKASTEYRIRKNKVRVPDNIKFTFSKKSRINFYNKRDNYFQKMNRSLGDEDNNEEDNRNVYTENNINSNNLYLINNLRNESFNRTHKVKKPKATNYNYNNYIKNTINFTNLYLDNSQFDRHILSNNINISQDSLKNMKENKSISTNMNRSDNYIINDNLSKNNLIIEPIPKKKNKKININISKKVYIKPKIVPSTSNNSKSPSVKDNENNYYTMPNKEPISIKNKFIIINSGKKEVENEDNNINNKNLVFNKLSPTLLSSISNDSQKVFNIIYSNYSDKFNNKNNEQGFQYKNQNNIKYINKNNNNNNRIIQYKEKEVNIYEHLDDNVDKFDNVNLNNENNNLLYKQGNIHLDFINNGFGNNYNPYYIEKMNEMKNIEGNEEDDYDVYLDKKMMTQRNITEEIKEEKYEDEDESENINLNENKKINNSFNDENDMSDIMKKEINTKENYHINNNISMDDNIMPEELKDKNMEKINYSGYNYDNNDSIEIVNDVDKFDNENNKNENKLNNKEENLEQLKQEEDKKEKMKLEEEERIKNEKREKEKEEEEEIAKKIEKEKEIIRKLEEERIKSEKERSKKEEERKRKIKKKEELIKEKEEILKEKNNIIEKEKEEEEEERQIKLEREKENNNNDIKEQPKLNEIQKNDEKMKEKEKEDKIGKKNSRFFSRRNDKEKEIMEKKINNEIINKNEKEEEKNKKKFVYRSKRQINKESGKIPKFEHNFDLNDIRYENNIKKNKNDSNKSTNIVINDEQKKETQKDNQEKPTSGFKSRFKINNDDDNSNLIKIEPIIRNSKTKFEKNFSNTNNNIKNENKNYNLKQMINEPVIKNTNTKYKNKVNINDNLRENENKEEKKEKRYDVGTFQNSIRNKYKNKK